MTRSLCRYARRCAPHEPADGRRVGLHFRPAESIGAPVGVIGELSPAFKWRYSPFDQTMAPSDGLSVDLYRPTFWQAWQDCRTSAIKGRLAVDQAPHSHPTLSARSTRSQIARRYIARL